MTDVDIQDIVAAARELGIEFVYDENGGVSSRPIDGGDQTLHESDQNADADAVPDHLASPDDPTHLSQDGPVDLMPGPIVPALPSVLSDGPSPTDPPLDLGCVETVMTRARTVWLVGISLIRRYKLYTQSGYDSMEAYCDARWDVSRRHVDRMAQSGDVLCLGWPQLVEMYVGETEQPRLGPNGSESEPLPPPANERQIRPLAALQKQGRSREEIRQVWQEAFDGSEGKPSAKHVEAAAKKLLTPSERTNTETSTKSPESDADKKNVSQVRPAIVDGCQRAVRRAGGDARLAEYVAWAVDQALQTWIEKDGDIGKLQDKVDRWAAARDTAPN